MIHALFTGGTISMRRDDAAGGAVPKLTAADLLAATPGLADVAEVHGEDWSALPGPHMTMDRMWALRCRIAELSRDPAVQGIVLTHGTDTMEETAYLVARSVQSRVPIVFTGAMRTSSDPGWDGPGNLLDAVRIAASGDPIAASVVLVAAGRIFSALDVTKTHTNDLDAFESPGRGPIGYVDDGAVHFQHRLADRRPTISPESLGGPVDIVLAWAGADARLLDASRETAAGCVVAAMGRGNVPVAMFEGVRRWAEQGKPIVITSRTGEGRVGTTYAYPGAGRRLVEAGAIMGGALRPTQARLELMIALGAGYDASQLGALFDAA